MKQALDAVVFALARSFIFALSVLPRPVGYFLCESIASLFYAADSKHRRIGLVNLRLAFPDKDDRWRRRVLHGSFRQLGTHAVEICKLSRMKPAELKRRVVYEEGFGPEHYHAAREDSSGILFVTAHISAWELLPAAHAVHTHPLRFLVRPLDNVYFDRWSQRLRSRFGNRVISKRGSLRSIIAAMRDGHDIGFLIDQNVQAREGVFVRFLGQTACTASGVAALADRTGARVVCGFIVPTERRGHYRIRFYPPLEAAGDLTDDTQRFIAPIEKVIREFPHCWLWGHRRFATQPDGRDLYA